MNGAINFNSSSSMPMETGNGLANLMLGNFQSYSQNNAHVYPYFRFQALDAFAQDSWKISRRFTMEFGVRFEHMVPTYTYTRDGTPQGEGTWKLYSVDLTKYDASKRPDDRSEHREDQGRSDGRVVAARPGLRPLLRCGSWILADQEPVRSPSRLCL